MDGSQIATRTVAALVARGHSRESAVRSLAWVQLIPPGPAGVERERRREEIGQLAEQDEDAAIESLVELLDPIADEIGRGMGDSYRRSGYRQLRVDCCAGGG